MYYIVAHDNGYYLYCGSTVLCSNIMKNIAFGIYFFFLSFNSKPNRTQNLQEEFIQHDDDYGTRRSFMVIQEESFSFKATQVKD